MRTIHKTKSKRCSQGFKNSQQFDGCRSICYGWSIEEKHRAQSFGFMLWLHEHRGWRCFSEVTNTSLFREQHEKRWSNSNRRDSKGEHNTHNTESRMYWWMNQTALINAKILIQRLFNREQHWRGRKCCTQQRTWSQHYIDCPRPFWYCFIFNTTLSGHSQVWHRKQNRGSWNSCTQ